ncbi:FMN-linked oxidoreductase [Pholiota conissans]|uniref:tRNA-dihydrouridine(47) synthase [NAD(P)(+)] n=1 Tax=Pholiota conissans TaxID=109636 RepID=A0A9P6CMS1_9AGAR|nr:FMN-linked oxidoreductase [Pholiota conissans]
MTLQKGAQRAIATNTAMTKEQKKAQRGQNKARRFGKVRDELDLCWRVANGAICEFGTECRYTHDIPSYLAAKARDIHIPEMSQTSDSAPFAPDQDSLVKPHLDYPTLDLSTVCPVFAETGECRYGFKCRFLGGHIKFSETGEMSLAGDEDKKARTALTSHEVNFVGADVQKALRSRKYKFPIADEYLRQLAAENTELNNKPKPVPTANSIVIGEPEQEAQDVEMSAPEPQVLVDEASSAPASEPAPLPETKADAIIEKRTGDAETTTKQLDTPDVRVRFPEKKRLHWKGKTYLAPLTTVGNLPFRRLCVDLGADITCGEMGLASSFLAGSKEEWSLVRRHPSEKIFGVQVAGNKPANLVPTAEVLAKECGANIDFVDVNCGCPIDLVFKSGSGSALLDSVGKLGKILVGMNRALGEIPVTVKLRTGVKDGKNTAHRLMPRLSTEWNAGCITLHGRSRQQRYTRLSDWDYIKQCVEAVRAKEVDEDLPPVPIFGGGDCFSSQDYWHHVETSGVDGVMIGRGALIKPWIFTEIQEKREWDISARERLELIRKYDTTGVNATRRYLCEALSFQYRYVPIGILEHLPGRINDRAPAFRGRNDLESLLSSPDSNDWVKISEMFLGPVPETWSFTPKHKSNAYGNEEGQG